MYDLQQRHYITRGGGLRSTGSTCDGSMFESLGGVQRHSHTKTIVRVQPDEVSHGIGNYIETKCDHMGDGGIIECQS